MTFQKQQIPIRAKLYYKDTCPPCRFLSNLVVILSAGTIKRVPISGNEAKEMYRLYPEHEGQLALLMHQKYTFGKYVFLKVPLCILNALWQIVRKTIIQR